jgi:hypothetical protein
MRGGESLYCRRHTALRRPHRHVANRTSRLSGFLWQEHKLHTVHGLPLLLNVCQSSAGRKAGMLTLNIDGQQAIGREWPH